MRTVVNYDGDSFNAAYAAKKVFVFEHTPQTEAKVLFVVCLYFYDVHSGVFSASDILKNCDCGFFQVVVIF